MTHPFQVGDRVCYDQLSSFTTFVALHGRQGTIVEARSGSEFVRTRWDGDSYEGLDLNDGTVTYVKLLKHVDLVTWLGWLAP